MTTAIEVPELFSFQRLRLCLRAILTAFRRLLDPLVLRPAYASAYDGPRRTPF